MVEMFTLLSQQLSDMQTSLDIIDARTEQILAYLQEPHRFAMSFSDWATFQ
jgi:C-terminal processing protease CtpA/Prc